MSTEKTTIAIVDDHALIRQALSSLINSSDAYLVTFDASNGIDMQQQFSRHQAPEIVLLDIAMPEMDGYECTLWLKAHYPDVKILVMSVNDSQETLYQMVKAGVNGFVLKESDIEEILRAFREIRKYGYYFSARMQGHLTAIIKRSLMPQPSLTDSTLLNQQEKRFLELLCTELSYNEICGIMHISYHTLDNYRDAIYRKLHVKSRTGSVLYAVKHGLVQV